MNKIKNLEVLEALRAHLPRNAAARAKAASESQRQSAQEPHQEPLSPGEAQAYGLAFDALLTLWQVIGTAPQSPVVAQAYRAATLRIQPLMANATQA
jgi:hypothetical protein